MIIYEGQGMQVLVYDKAVLRRQLAEWQFVMKNCEVIQTSN